MKAKNEHVLIRIPGQAVKSKGGVLLPENTSQRFEFGRVVSVGEKVHNVAVGELVVFDIHGAVPVRINPNEKEMPYVVAHKEQVFLTLEEAELAALGVEAPPVAAEA